MSTEKTLNRRDFIKLTAAGGAVFSTQGCEIMSNQNTTKIQTTIKPSLKIRKNVNCLNDDEKKTLKKVVMMLKNNGTWVKLAEIHKHRCSKIHGTEFFLPWHRAYLSYFEQIARQIPGCSNFTLPYWDWTTSPNIPSIFGENPDEPWDQDLDTIKPPDSWKLPPDTSPRQCTGPDALWKRCPEPNAFAGKLDEDISATSIYGIIGRDRTSSYAGQLESGSHSIIHSFIEGNMRSPETAALDPIFWLHHANIDRLWSKWMENNVKITPSPDCPIEGCENCQSKYPSIITEWLKTPLYIEIESKSSDLKVYDLIDSRRLGYIYEGSAEVIVWENCPKLTKFLPNSTVESNFDNPKVININNFLPVSFSVSFNTPEKVNNLEKIQKYISDFFQNRLRETSDSPLPSVLLTIEVKKPENPAIAVKIFVHNSSSPPELTTDSPSYVSTFSFFESPTGHHHHDQPDQKSGTSRHFIFDVTDAVLKLENFNLFNASISVFPELIWDKAVDETDKLTLLGFGLSLAQ